MKTKIPKQTEKDIKELARKIMEGKFKKITLDEHNWIKIKLILEKRGYQKALEDVQRIIDEIKIDLDMPRSQETWNWIKGELKNKIKEIGK